MSGFLFTSACAPTFLSVKENNEIELNVIPKYFEYLYENGIRSFFINGGCGEFSSLTVAERKLVLEKWVEVAKNDVQIVVNIGTSNMTDTIELGNHALTFNNICCVAIVPPFYMPIPNEMSLLIYLKSIANGMKKKIPILYYHIPSNSKIKINVNNFLNLIKEQKFSQLTAIKFTDSNFENFQDFVNGIKLKDLHINLFCGYEPLLEKTIKSGAKGAILAFVNIKPKLIHSVINGSLNECQRSDLSVLINLFRATESFSQTNKQNLIGLLKIATEFYSNVKLGPMKKPYNIDEDKVIEFHNLLKNYKFSQ